MENQVPNEDSIAGAVRVAVQSSNRMDKLNFRLTDRVLRVIENHFEDAAKAAVSNPDFQAALERLAFKIKYGSIADPANPPRIGELRKNGGGQWEAEGILKTHGILLEPGIEIEIEVGSAWVRTKVAHHDKVGYYSAVQGTNFFEGMRVRFPNA